jgi:hypothetical protein
MPSPATGPQGRSHDTSAALFADYSLDMTGKIGAVETAWAVIPPGTRLHVGFTDSQDLARRVSAARAVRRSGFVPVPVIAARRLRSEAMLREYLDTLRAAGVSGSVLVVAGDPAQPQGPYPDTASVIGSGLLEEFGYGGSAWPATREGTRQWTTGRCGPRWPAKLRRWSTAGWAGAWSLSSGSTRGWFWRGSLRALAGRPGGHGRA